MPALIAALCNNGDPQAVIDVARPAHEGRLPALMAQIDTHFAGDSLRDILNSLRGEDSDFAVDTLKALGRNSPLSMACAVEMVHRLRGNADIRAALDMEYRFTFRAMEQADFLEGIRAAIIDKDRNPRWRHDLDSVTQGDVEAILAPLGADALTFEEEEQP